MSKATTRQSETISCARKLTVILALNVFLSAGALAQSSGGGEYTKEQAATGKSIFDKTCSVCHGDHLQGGVGPALSGQMFLSVSQYQKISAAYFYHFMSTHMPLTNPGSLSKEQYLDIMAYMLEVNGYPAGSHQLTDNSEELQAIKIEPQH
jgi:mono/diheme cytochrome c family protein